MNWRVFELQKGKIINLNQTFGQIGKWGEECEVRKGEKMGVRVNSEGYTW